MNSINLKRSLSLLIGTSWAVLSGLPAVADDTELFVTDPSLLGNQQPNILLIIDTSGSMLDSSWTLAQKMLRETLEAYPKVKGIQVMNDDGVYMFREYTARWMPDSPGRRQAIVTRMRSWNATSDSNPVNGIEAAIRDFRAPDKKISIYVFGDDYQGSRSIDQAMATISRLNTKDADGERLIRIHGVGFPGRFGSANVPQTAASFATFMRAVCATNGGTFVALSTR